MKNKLGWYVVFLSLFLMTFVTVSDLFGSGINSALAKGVKENKGSKFLVLGSETGKGFMKKIGSLMDSELLCSVNEEQLAGLSGLYQTSVEEVIIDGVTVELVRIGGDKVKRKDITEFLGSSCKPVKSHKWYYLLFSANVS